MLKITIPADSVRVMERLKKAPHRLLPAVLGAIDHQNELTVSHIQVHFLSFPGPQTLGVRTNRLRSSVRRSRARLSGGRITATIGSNVKYLGPHEFGTEPFTIVPKNKRALSFIGQGGAQITVKKVNHPGFPTRAPIRRGIEARMPAYGKAIASALQEVT